MIGWGGNLGCQVTATGAGSSGSSRSGISRRNQKPKADG